MRAGRRSEVTPVMTRIEKLLLDAGLVTLRQVREGLTLQEVRAGRLGAFTIRIGGPDGCDHRATVESITRALEAAIDRVTANRFSRAPGHSIVFDRLVRRTSLVESLLDPESDPPTEITVDGAARLVIDGQESLPALFSLDMESGFALLDEPSEMMVRRWTDMLERKRRTASPAA